MNGFSESNVPRPARRTSPPLGAPGLTYSRFLASAGYLRSPWVAKPWLTTVPDAVWARRTAGPPTHPPAQRAAPPASTLRRLIPMTRAPEPNCTRYIARPSWAALWPPGYFAVSFRRAGTARAPQFTGRDMLNGEGPVAGQPAGGPRAGSALIGFAAAGPSPCHHGRQGPPCEFDLAMAEPQLWSMADSHL